MFRNAVSKKFGPLVGNCVVIVTVVQFHLPFYMSRPLANTFALSIGIELSSFSRLTLRSIGRIFFLAA